MTCALSGYGVLTWRSPRPTPARDDYGTREALEAVNRNRKASLAGKKGKEQVEDLSARDVLGSSE